MAKHKARSLGASVTIAAVMAIVASVLFSIVGIGSASAELYPVAPGKKAQPSDSHVTGICNMTVQSVNPSTGQVGLRLAAQAKPTALGGYFTNAYTQVFCTVFNSTFAPVASNNPFRNGPTVPNTATMSSVPYSPVFYVCGFGFVKLNNGNQYTTATVCA